MVMDDGLLLPQAAEFNKQLIQVVSHAHANSPLHKIKNRNNNNKKKKIFLSLSRMLYITVSIESLSWSGPVHDTVSKSRAVP